MIIVWVEVLVTFDTFMSIDVENFALTIEVCVFVDLAGALSSFCQAIGSGKLELLKFRQFQLELSLGLILGCLDGEGCGADQREYFRYTLHLFVCFVFISYKISRRSLGYIPNRTRF